VVATGHGGSRETIVPGTTGWLVPPCDPPALAAAIGAALGLAPAERAALARRAADHVAANFTREAMCARTIVVYEELLFAPADEAAVAAWAAQ
jgi:glycosyltransferase involved in cell wall biosynthesis